MSKTWKRMIYLVVSVPLAPIAWAGVLVAVVLVLVGVLFAIPMETLTRVQEWSEK